MQFKKGDLTVTTIADEPVYSLFIDHATFSIAEKIANKYNLSSGNTYASKVCGALRAAFNHKAEVMKGLGHEPQDGKHVPQTGPAWNIKTPGTTSKSGYVVENDIAQLICMISKLEGTSGSITAANALKEYDEAMSAKRGLKK